jgi:hypothetical protein
MKHCKGTKTPVAVIILLAVAVPIGIMGIVFFLKVSTNIFYGNCWGEPTGKLTELKNGDNIIDFKECVEKVIFVDHDGLAHESIRNEIDIYESCNEKDRIKDHGSFLIIIPTKDPELPTFTKIYDTLTSGELLKPVCVWRSYGVYQKVVFEGSGKKHCIHMEDYQKNPPVKIISEC